MTRSFKDRYRDFQELVRELNVVRTHNLRFKAGDPQETLLLMSEAALILVVLERFLRMIVPDGSEDDTLRNLLEKATSRTRRLLILPGDRDTVIGQMVDIRNTLLHGNYEQAATQSGCSNVEEYFRTQFAPEVEGMYRLVNLMVAQIDVETGSPKSDP